MLQELHSQTYLLMTALLKTIRSDGSEERIYFPRFKRNFAGQNSVPASEYRSGKLKAGSCPILR